MAIATGKRGNTFVESVPKKIHTKDSEAKNEPSVESEDPKTYFRSSIFEKSNKDSLKQEISDAQPYHWGTIKDLIDDKLLRGVREEIMNEIHFTKKETDIYKVYQSGDLANLSRLSAELKERLPSLYKVRTALYSQAFRDMISEVTGCGKLSGVKTDISIHLYNRTCHLLTHDDVIGSRRISFILYMPDPNAEWKSSYGGALRLFDSIVPNVPQSDPHSKLYPQFNQIAFFKVQPGKSFHDVEEVKASKDRLSLQGWFHIPQKGEVDYDPNDQDVGDAPSTLQLLETQNLRDYDFPKPDLSPIPDPQIAQSSLELTAADKKFLLNYMNPYLLSRGAMGQLSETFAQESVVDIMTFLNEEYSDALKHNIKRFELNEYPHMPSKQAEIAFPWKLAIPSHKQRYMYIDGTSQQDISSAEAISKVNHTEPLSNSNFDLTADIFKLRATQEATADEDAVTCNEVSSQLCELAALFRSIQFAKWLYQVTQLKTLKDRILIRRFRPGHDFTLATKLDSHNDETNDSILDGTLEATLNLTPTSGWENGEWGGYELCMIDEAPQEDDSEKLNEDEAAIYRSSDTDESIVYESQACWNKLCLMFRDPSVMKFVKYVSADAAGSRWDVSAEWSAIDDSDDN